MTTAADILARLEHLGIKLGLETTRRILAALGDPQRAYPVVLVAGTNGKGSTAAFLQSMLRQAGYRTGFYSSPHLERPCERIRIDGRAIEEEALESRLAAVVSAGESRNRSTPTYFEALTTAAYAHFAAEHVELAVVEVGMGGRLDSTNAAEPALSLVTPIALDHREYLGESLAAIAGEKAGILRAGVPALSAEQEPEAMAAISGAATRLATPLRSARELAAIVGVESRGWDGQDVTLGCEGEPLRASTRLLGPHQPGNLALAAAAMLALRRLGFARCDLGAISRGAAACRWPGRLETVDLPGGRRVVLDGAHNPAGIAALAAFLREVGGEVDLLFGALADKDAADMLPRLVPHSARLILTAPPSPRALDPRDLAVLAGGGCEVAIEADPTRALGLALGLEGGRPLLVCGSLYLIGDLRAELRRRFATPEDLAAI